MTDKRPLILIATGGTGGHVYPGLAVAQEFAARGYRVAWLGTRKGLESRVVPANDIDIYYLPVQGVRGKNPFSKLWAMTLVWFATLRAMWLILKLRPACVVGLGGYVSGPAGLAAWLLRRPLLIHEQNSVAGTANRMLVPFAKRIAAGFPGAFRSRRAERKLTVTGNPLRRELVQAGAVSTYDYDGSRPLRLLIVGGSQGAGPINEVVPGALRRLLRDRDPRIEIWHQTGDLQYPDMQRRYADLASEQVKFAPFIEHMAGAYQWADLVLCRAGALTVSELAVMGRPSILVPLPQAIDDHQRLNAQTLVDARAGTMVLQSELDAHRLSKLLREFIVNTDLLKMMSAAAYQQGRPEATKQVCDFCEALIND